MQTINAPATITDIGHFIGGKHIAGTSARSGEVYNPATGVRRGRVAFAEQRRSRRGRCRRGGGVPGLGGTRRRCAARACCSSSRSCSKRMPTSSPRMITREHGKTFCRRARRTGARARGRRVRLRHPAPAQGRVHRTTSVPISTASRCVSRSASCAGHHAVQLPGDGADVDVPGRDRLREHFHPEAVGTRSLGSAIRIAELLQRSRTAGRACSTSSTATRAPSMRFSSIPDITAVSFVGSTPIARVHLRNRHAANGKRVQALGGAKNHVVVMPDADLGSGRRCADGRGYRLGGRALHGDLGRGCGRRDQRMRSSSAGAASARRSRSDAAATTASRWGRSSPACTATMTSLIDKGVKEGAKLVVDGRGLHAPQGERLLRRRHALRPRDAARCRSTARRSSGPCSRVVRAKIVDEALELINDARVRQRHRDLHPRRRNGARVRPTRSQSAWSASTCRFRCRWRSTVSAAGSARSSAITPIHGTEGVRFYTRSENDDGALATNPQRRRIQLPEPEVDLADGAAEFTHRDPCVFRRVPARHEDVVDGRNAALIAVRKSYMPFAPAYRHPEYPSGILNAAENRADRRSVRRSHLRARRFNRTMWAATLKSTRA